MILQFSRTIRYENYNETRMKKILGTSACKHVRVIPRRAGISLCRVVRTSLLDYIAHSSLVYFSSASLGEYRASNYDSVSAYGSTYANTEETFVYTQKWVIEVVIKFSRTAIFT